MRFTSPREAPIVAGGGSWKRSCAIFRSTWESRACFPSLGLSQGKDAVHALPVLPLVVGARTGHARNALLATRNVYRACCSPACVEAGSGSPRSGRRPAPARATGHDGSFPATRQRGQDAMHAGRAWPPGDDSQRPCLPFSRPPFCVCTPPAFCVCPRPSVYARALLWREPRPL